MNWQSGLTIRPNHFTLFKAGVMNWQSSPKIWPTHFTLFGAGVVNWGQIEGKSGWPSIWP